MSVGDDIERLRRRIDDLDLEIRKLLNERAGCALAIGEAKKITTTKVYDPEREAAILRRVLQENPGPLQDEALRRLFERILDESRRLERIAVEEGRKEKG